MPVKLRFGVNPIIVKELRSRMRGVRAFATLTGVLLVLAGISYVLYQIVLVNSRYSSAPLSPRVGQTLFAGLAFLELIMVCGITPAVTAGALASEQEKQTYEMLLATPLRPASILWGKLVSALSYVFLLLFAAVPMASLVFIFGGVAPRDMIKSLVVLFVVAVMFGVLGLFMSALLGRSGRATVLSYLVVLVLLFGPMFAAVAYGVLRQAEPPRWILIPSPINALSSALAPSLGSDLGGALYFLGGWFRGIDQPISATGIPRPLYHYSLPFFGLFTLVLYLAANRLVRPARRWRIARREIVTALIVLLVFAGAVALAFLGTSDRYENYSIFVNPTPFVSRDVVGQAVAVPAREVRVQEPTPTPVPPPANPDDSGAAGPAEGAVPPGDPGSFSPYSEEDTAEIYTAAIRQFYTFEPPSDRKPDFPLVFLVRQIDPSLGAAETSASGPAALSAPIQAALVENLSDLPSEFIWIDAFEDAPLEDDGAVADGGVIFTLGSLDPKTDAVLTVPVSLYAGRVGVIAEAFEVSRVDGAWKVTGNVSLEGGDS